MNGEPDRQFRLPVNAECSMPWAVFAIGPAVLIAATICAAALTASALAGSWAGAHLTLCAALPCAIALLPGADSRRLHRLRLLTTAAAAATALAAPLVAAHPSSVLPELQTLWFLLSYGTTGGGACGALAATVRHAARSPANLRKSEFKARAAEHHSPGPRSGRHSKKGGPFGPPHIRSGRSPEPWYSSLID